MSDNILLIDDDQDTLLITSKALSLKIRTAKISACTNTHKAKKLLVELAPSVVVLDLCLLGTSDTSHGFELLQYIVKLDETCRVIMLTGHGDTSNGVKALQLGASNFLKKPCDIDHLSALVQDALNQSKLRKELLHFQKEKELKLLDLLVGESQPIIKLKEDILYASSNNLPVLLSGPTGTGKNLVASLIHQLSKRSAERLIRYQPNFTSPEMVNSDLFGHIKGAFTGAEQNRTGLVSASHKGTLFLDEIDELPQEVQVSLLGVLQDKTYKALGSNEEQHSDFRLITACNKDLEDSLSQKRLRADFYHRISNIIIKLPTLNARKSDIPLLVKKIIDITCKNEALINMTINDSAIKLLIDYNWQGNVRELQAKVESAVMLANFKGKEVIEPSDFAMLLSQNSAKESSTISNFNYNEQVNNFKKQLASKALEQCDFNQVRTAKLLGVDRSTLRRILGNLGTPTLVG